MNVLLIVLLICGPWSVGFYLGRTYEREQLMFGAEDAWVEGYNYAQSERLA